MRTDKERLDQEEIRHLRHRARGAARRDREGSEVRRDEYTEQPDSGSRIGGHRGEQEYGLSGDLVKDYEHHTIRPAGTETESDTVPEGDDPTPYEIDDGFAGASEWSVDHAVLEEEELEKEPLDVPVAKAKGNPDPSRRIKQ